MLEKLYGKNSIFKEIEDLKNLKDEHQKNVQNLVLDELNNLRVKGDFQKITEIIRTDISLKKGKDVPSP